MIIIISKANISIIFYIHKKILKKCYFPEDFQTTNRA